jgi:hypothetical protein
LKSVVAPDLLRPTDHSLKLFSVISPTNTKKNNNRTKTKNSMFPR